MTPRTLAVLAAVALTATAAAAADFELTPLVGFRTGGQLDDPSSAASYTLDATPSFGLVVGWPLDADRVLELNLSHQESEVTTLDQPPLEPAMTVGFAVDYAHLGGTYSWGQPRLRGFVTGYVGGAFLDPDLPGYGVRGFFSLAFGGGARVPLSDRVALRVEGLGLGILELGGGGAFCGGGSCILGVSGGGTIQFEGRVGLAIRL